jgi:hypothetical protein
VAKSGKSYEFQTSDSREIFRAAGIGEAQVAMNVALLTQEDSPKIRLGANKLAAEIHPFEPRFLELLL